jgi:hypothetical protein
MLDDVYFVEDMVARRAYRLVGSTERDRTLECRVDCCGNQLVGDEVDPRVDRGCHCDQSAVRKASSDDNCGLNDVLKSAEHLLNVTSAIGQVLCHCVVLYNAIQW